MYYNIRIIINCELFIFVYLKFKSIPFSDPGYSGGNAGASHAGEGGITHESSTIGTVYGDFRNPVTMGSGGQLTRPGGALFIQGTNVTIHGHIWAK